MFKQLMWMFILQKVQSIILKDEIRTLFTTMRHLDKEGFLDYSEESLSHFDGLLFTNDGYPFVKKEKKDYHLVIDDLSTDCSDEIIDSLKPILADIIQCYGIYYEQEDVYKYHYRFNIIKSFIEGIHNGEIDDINMKSCYFMSVKQNYPKANMENFKLLLDLMLSVSGLKSYHVLHLVKS
jgi:hypothetical protein